MVVPNVLQPKKVFTKCILTKKELLLLICLQKIFLWVDVIQEDIVSEQNLNSVGLFLRHCWLKFLGKRPSTTTTIPWSQTWTLQLCNTKDKDNEKSSYNLQQ